MWIMNWEKCKRDRNIEPHLHVKQELPIAEGLIFRGKRIVLPEALQRKVVKLGHNLGHLGKTTDQTTAEREILVPCNEQHDRHSNWPVLRMTGSYKREQARTHQSDEYPQ